MAVACQEIDHDISTVGTQRAALCLGAREGNFDTVERSKVDETVAR